MCSLIYLFGGLSEAFFIWTSSFFVSPFSDFLIYIYLMFYDLLTLDMNRNHRNRGGLQGQRPTRHTRNNPFYDDLFASSRALLEASSESLRAIATLGRGEPIDAPLLAEIVRQRLSDFARPVVQRQTTRVNAPLQRGANFEIDSHILGLLPTFHGLPSEVPYRHVDEFSQVCEFNQFHNVPSETAKMRFFPFTLKERAKEWFFTLGREFDSWRDMEDAFLRKYYSVGKTSVVRCAICQFSQGPVEVFCEAWERLRDLLRQCPHHGIP